MTPGEARAERFFRAVTAWPGTILALSLVTVAATIGLLGLASCSVGAAVFVPVCRAMR